MHSQTNLIFCAPFSEEVRYKVSSIIVYNLVFDHSCSFTIATDTPDTKVNTIDLYNILTYTRKALTTDIPIEKCRGKRQGDLAAFSQLPLSTNENHQLIIMNRL